MYVPKVENKSSSNDIKKRKEFHYTVFSASFIFNWCIFIPTSYEKIFVYFFLTTNTQKKETIKEKLMTEHYLLILIFINPLVFSVCFPLNRCRVAKTNKLWLAKLSLCS